MPYDYNSTSSLAHARNFKYIKREPDGKGGWRYYYDVKKHGTDIRKRVEDKTGITAARKDVETTKRNITSADRNLATTKKELDIADRRASSAHDKAKNTEKARDTAYDNVRIAAGTLITYSGDGTAQKNMEKIRNTPRATQVYGEQYRDASIANDKAQEKRKQTFDTYKKAANKYDAAEVEYEKAKKEHEEAVNKYNNIPLVKLTKEIKSGGETIKKWLASFGEHTKDDIFFANYQLSKAEEAFERVSKETEKKNDYESLSKLRKAKDDVKKAKANAEAAKDKYYKETIRGTIEDKLGFDENEEAFKKYTSATFADSRYRHDPNNETRGAKNKAIDEFNIAMIKYLDTPIGKIEALPYTIRGKNYHSELLRKLSD